MAKTISEIIEVELNFNKIDQVEIIEVFCGFNQEKEKTVFLGNYADIPDYLKDLKFMQSSSFKNKMTIKYLNRKSFEGKEIHCQMQIQQQK